VLSREAGLRGMRIFTTVKRPRRRLALKLAACALAGAVLTVAVAWAAPIVYRGRPAPFAARSEGGWLVAPPAGWPKRPGFRVSLRATGVSLNHESYPYPRLDQLVFCTGWPARALRAVERWESGRTVLATGIEPPGRLRTLLRDNWLTDGFPVAPVWPGFAVDTAFYGTIAFALWSAPAAIRRRVRKRRGRCPACGYDLRGITTGPCPECGFQREGREEREAGSIQTPS
jgi:hypothetical protein